jgi:hypothetical protein
MKPRPKSSPDKELLWVNFKAGVAKGFGVTVGMTLVLGVFVWIMTQLVDLPVVGEYFEDAKQFAVDYTEKTNYSGDFEEMNQLLREINENTKN